MTRPLVSCIISTRDRPRFIPQAIRCFLRHRGVAAELIIVDGGDERVAPLCTGIDSVRYVRAAPGATYGACLNIGADAARGEILQTRDDDDYYAPGFLARAVDAVGDGVVAWDCFYIFVGDAALRFSGHGWAAGATLTFRREVWDRTRFRDDGAHQDWHFMQDSGAPLSAVCAPDLYMLVRHGANNWRTLAGNTDVDTYFRSLPPSARSICDAVEEEDVAFYSRLGRS